MIRIIDCGSQYTQNIARRVREHKVYAEIVPFHTIPSEIFKSDLEGIIISGGQYSVYEKGSPLYPKEILESPVPILGICYGQQSIAYLLGGKVEQTSNKEYGKTTLNVLAESPLFSSLPETQFTVWMSHGDVVTEAPSGFQIVAKSAAGHVASMQNTHRNIYAVQFHPEVDHTTYGRKILDNFLKICNAQRTWNSAKQYEMIVEAISRQVEGKHGIGAVSGGVDSTTASVLMKRIAGKNYYPIFVDNGLLRLNEEAKVRESLGGLCLDFYYVDASFRFLRKLNPWWGRVTDPDKKRKIIGHEFIRIFEEQARKLEESRGISINYLVQGTLYPDVIESVPVHGSSSKIKRHHNVGGLPEKMNLELVEPFRNLFKDEVRKIASEQLKIPEEIVRQHPFPGPGLAVRIMGAITPEKLDVARKADAIFIEELRKRGLYSKISQAFAGVLDARAVGVKGDTHTYDLIVGLRAVVTRDFMTADAYQFEGGDLQAISTRIMNEVPGVGRDFYDTSQKTPATIEWE